MSEHESSDRKQGFTNAHEMTELGVKPPKQSAAEIRYVSPGEQSPDEMPQHKFELIQDGEVVGGAEIDFYSRPLPLYQLTDLWVDEGHAGKGEASRIMSEVEAFLKDRRKPGVLVDAIAEDVPAHGMYERRGWKPDPTSKLRRVYNWPENVPKDILKGYPLRYTLLSERESWADKFEK